MGNRPLPPEDLAHILQYAQEALAELTGAKLFITGGTGFFGHWLLESLLYANRELDLGVSATVLTRNAEAFRASSPHIADDPAITLCEGDVRSFDFPARAFTHVIHAAADSTGKQAEQTAYELAESIIDGTRRVLRLARASGASRLLYVSTGAVYGRSSSVAHIPETHTGSPDPLLLQSAYDEAKRMAENLCVAYAEGAAFEPVIARCFAFVGPHLPLDSHFAIGNFIQAAVANQPIDIRGDGTPRRSWLYMADLAIWLWTLLAKGQANRAYNVGSDEACTIAEAAQLTAATLRPNADGESGLAVRIAGTPNPNALVNSYVPAIDRARDELGLAVRIPLAEALRRTAAWHGYHPPTR